MTPDEFKAALKTLGWSQRYFAERYGITTETVNSWATGRNESKVAAWAVTTLKDLLAIRESIERLGITK